MRASGTRDAAQVAFFLLLSFPALLLLVASAFATVLADQSVRGRIVAAIVDVLPLSDPAARDQIQAVLDSVAAGAGSLGVVGAVSLLYSASGAIGALRHAVNEAFGGRDPRPYAVGKALDAGLTLVVAPTVIVALGLNLSGKLAAAIGDHPWLVAVAQFAVTELLPFGLMYGVLVLLFWRLPVSHAPMRAVWPGALVGLVGVLLVEFGTSVYYGLFGEVNAVYGTLGVLLAVVFSQYLGAIAVVYGAHVTAQAARPATRVSEGGRAAGTRERRPLGRVVLEALRGLVVRERRPRR